MDILQLTANLGGKTRREKLHGRDYLVAPVSLIVPGVLNGSDGPLYYPIEEVTRNPAVWNGMPVVVNHPTDNGRPVSARNPKVLDKFQIGAIYSATANGKLAAEAWIDIEKANAVDNRILNALLQGKPVEVSTGLSLTKELAEKDATYNGVAYTHVARNYVPDHLAVLPDQLGACSVKDGCGMLVNEGIPDEKMKRRQQRMKDMEDMDEEEMDEHMKAMDAKRKSKKGGTMNAEQRKAAIDNLIANSCGCYDESDRETLNKYGDEKLNKLVANAAKAKEAEAVANAAKQGFEDQRGDSHVFNEKTGKWEHKPKAPAPPENKSEGQQQVQNQQTPPKQQTYEEWMATAPPELRSAVANARKIEMQAKQSVVSKLVANLADPAEKKRVGDYLLNKELDELELMEKLLPVANAETNNAPLYTGRGVPLIGGQTTQQQQVQNDRNDILPIHAEIPWGEWSAERDEQRKKQA